MDADEIRFDAFKDAVSRCRWFILATVIVSSLILFHAYLERWSYAEAQLQQVIANRLLYNTEAAMQHEEAELKRQVANNEKLDMVKLKNWAESKYVVDQTSLDLKNIQQPDRSLPFLDLKIPFNDYLPIMAVMLTVFCVGAWLNVRSIWAAASTFLTDPVLRDLARVHFTFTGVLDHPSQRKAANVVQFVVLWLPFGTLLIAAGIDFYYMYSDFSEGYTLGPRTSLFLRIGTLLAMLAICFWAGRSSYGVAREIDFAFATASEMAAPTGTSGAIRYLIFWRRTWRVTRAPDQTPDDPSKG